MGGSTIPVAFIYESLRSILDTPTKYMNDILLGRQEQKIHNSNCNIITTRKNNLHYIWTCWLELLKNFNIVK